MDNSPTSWAPRPALLGVGWLVTAITVVGAVLTARSGDSPGALLFGVAAVGVGAFTLHGTVVRPRLTADFTGLRARSLSGTVSFTWPDTRVHLRTTRRLGRDAVTIEVENGDHLLVLGWLELGEDPRDVVDVLSALRAHG